MLAVARRGLAAAINDAENGIGHLSCDDPKIMEQVRAHWRRLYDTYMNADALFSDLESCARHLTDGDKWEPNPIADGMKPMEMAKGCACFIAETPDGVLIIPSEPTPGENTAKRLANTLNALTGDVLLDATGIRLLGTQFLFAYHSRLDRPVDYGVNLTGMRFPDRPRRPPRRHNPAEMGEGPVMDRIILYLLIDLIAIATGWVELSKIDLHVKGTDD